MDLFDEKNEVYKKVQVSDQEKHSINQLRVSQQSFFLNAMNTPALLGGFYPNEQKCFANKNMTFPPACDIKKRKGG